MFDFFLVAMLHNIPSDHEIIFDEQSRKANYVDIDSWYLYWLLKENTWSQFYQTFFAKNLVKKLPFNFTNDSMTDFRTYIFVKFVGHLLNSICQKRFMQMLMKSTPSVVGIKTT